MIDHQKTKNAFNIISNNYGNYQIIIDAFSTISNNYYELKHLYEDLEIDYKKLERKLREKNDKIIELKKDSVRLKYINSKRKNFISRIKFLFTGRV